MHVWIQLPPSAGPGQRFQMSGQAVAAKGKPRHARQLDSLDHAPVGQGHRQAGRDVATGFDDAIVAQGNTRAGIGADEAALADGHHVLVAAGDPAHQ